MPNSMLDETVQWYHQVLLHVGVTHLMASIGTHFCHPNLNKRVAELMSSCRECQQCKHPGCGCGHLPPRESLFQPFAEVAVDSVGPWRISVDGQQMTFRALTMIDTVSNLVEMKCCECNGRAASHVFEHEWLCRHPRPNKCMHDNGAEFNNHDFQFLLANWGIKSHPISVKNLQANSICE